MTRDTNGSGRARRRWESREVPIDTSQLSKLAIVGAFVLAGAGAVWFWPSAAPVEEVPPATVAPGPATPSVTLHVSGAVAAPGLVHVPAGARVADAIAAAGGVLPGADVGALNLAAPVHDGEQVRVVDAAELATAGGGGGDPPDDGRVHINDADAATLELLPGVGPVLAARILAHRQQKGPFATIEDLLDVAGIGEGRLAAMRDVVAIP